VNRLRQMFPRVYFDMATVMSGTFTRNLLRGIVKLLVAGFLTTQSLGILRAVYGFFKIIVSLGDFALDYACVTFVAAAIKRGDTDEQEKVLSTVLVLKLIVIAILVLLGNLAAPRITAWVFADPSLTIYTRLVFLAAGGQLLWRYISGYLSAHQQFGRFAFFMTTGPALMLIATGVLIVTGRFDLRAGILLYLFTPVVTVALWWAALDRGLIRLRSLSRPLTGRILRFSRWVYASSVSSASRSHLNPILLKNPHLSGTLSAGEANAGLYSFGNDLANELTVLSQSLLTVLLPKASRKTSAGSLSGFIKSSYKHLAMLALPLLLLVFAAKPLLLLLGYFKASYLEYLPSLRIFAILYVGTLFSVAAVPMKTALYSMRKPHVETWIEMASLPLLVVGSILAIPRFGGEGAAIVVLVQRLLTSVALVFCGFIALRRAKDAPVDPEALEGPDDEVG